MDTPAGKALNTMQNLFNKGDIDGFRAIFSPNARLEAPAGNVEGIDEIIEKLKVASGKIGKNGMTIDQPTVEGNRAWAKFTFKKMMMTLTVKDTVEVDGDGKITLMIREKQ
eukprot:Rmarinus@m.16549